MSGELTVLLRVKTLKEAKALREANAKRDAAERAAAEAEKARGTAAESEATMGTRQDAIYHEILGKIVNMTAIEITKSRVVQLEKDHGKLVDAQERAVHVHARAETERDDAIRQHRQSVKARDKYILLTDREREARDAAAEYREEIEIEDLFSTTRRGVSWR